MDDRLLQLEEEIQEIKGILFEVHGAVVGNKLSKDGGMIKRLFEAEVQLAKLRDKLDVVEKKQIRYNIYTIILWITAGFVASGLFSYVLLLIFKR